MRNILLLVFVIFILHGCYTLIKHPDVEVLYEDDQQNEALSEPYDVFVDEDCSYCHQDFRPRQHFNPLIPAHQTQLSHWKSLPWWFDDEYLSVFGEGNTTGENNTGSNDSYQHVESLRRTGGSSGQSGGYIMAPGNSNNQASQKNSQDSEETSGGNQRNIIKNSDSQNDSGENKSDDKKRKFRKRN